MKAMNFVRIEHSGKPVEDWFLLLSLADLDILEAEWEQQTSGKDLAKQVSDMAREFLSTDGGDPHTGAQRMKELQRDLKAQTAALAHGRPTHHPCFAYLRRNPDRRVAIRPHGTYFSLVEGYDEIVDFKKSEGFPS